MNKFIEFLFRFKWPITIIIPIISIILGFNLKHLEIDGSYRVWFEEDSKTLHEYDKFREEFSNDNGVTVVFKDENGIFNKKALGTIARITEALKDMNHVDKVSSLTNYQHVYSKPSDPDNVLVDDFIDVDNLDDATPEYFEKRKQIALNDHIIVNGFVSANATTTMIFARLEPNANEGEDISGEVMKDVHAIVDPEVAITGYKYWFNGGPPMTRAFIDIAAKDAITFTPMVIILAMSLLFLMFRHLSGSLVPVLVVLFTSIIVISIQTMLGYKLNNFTANIPVFVMAIGIADAVHIYSIWLLRRKEGADNYQAVYDAVSKNFIPILFTTLTTAVGFATLIISKVVPVSTLGLATASGAMLAFFISIIWMPSVLFLLNVKVDDEEIAEEKAHKSWGYGKFIVENDKKIILIFLGLFLVFGYGLFKVKIDSNTIRYFDEEVDIRQASEFTMNNLTGSMSYTFIVNSEEKEGIKEPKFLRTLDKFYTDYRKEFPKDVRHMSSLLDSIKRYNKIMNNSETVPNTRNLVAQYLLLYSISLPADQGIEDKVDFDNQKLRVTVLTNIVDTSKDLKMIYFAQNWWKNTPYSIVVTGQTAMYAFMQKDITDTLVYSLSLTILIVSFMMYMIFRRIKILWILVLPNILPLALVLGVMGWLGITIDMGVAISGAIIIGVAVDDSIHFLVKYFDARKKGLSMIDTLDEVLHYAGRAILFTTVVLSFSFFIFVFSTFSPNQHFGIVTGIALTLALLIDILFLPALLSITNCTVLDEVEGERKECEIEVKD